MIEITHLSRCYGEFKAVDDVSFPVEPGEVVGLLGHNVPAAVAASTPSAKR